MKSRPLRRILAYHALAITTLPFLVVLLLASLWLLPEIRRESLTHQMSLANVIATQVEGYLGAAGTAVGNIALLLSEEADFNVRHPDFIDKQVNSLTSLELIYLAGADGHIRAIGSAPAHMKQARDLLGLDYSRNRFYLEARSKRKPIWSGTFLSIISGGLAVALAVPTPDAVVFGEIDLDNFTRYLHTHFNQPDQLLLIIDQKGQIIADREGVYTAQQHNINNIPLVHSGLEQGRPMSGEFSFQNQTMIGCLAPVPSLGWAVMVAQPLKSVYQRAWTTAKAGAIGILAAGCCGLLVAMVLSRKLAGRFETLANHTELVAHGENIVNWPSSDISEFSQLARNLEQMGVRLHERKRELDQARATLLTALQQSPTGIIIADAADNRVRMANQAAEEILRSGGALQTGASLEFDTPRAWRLFHPDGDEYPLDHYPLTSIIRTGETLTNCELRMQRADGSSCWLLINGAPMRDASGTITGGIIVFSDVTARRQTKAALREAKEFNENLIQTANILILGLDRQGRITLANETTSRATGYPQQQLLGRDWFELTLTGDEAAVARRAFNIAIEQQIPGASEQRLKTRDGRQLLISWRNSPIRSGAEVVGMLGCGIDITEQRRIEQQLLHSQKLESLGILAGGIAHDFNNILMSVLGNAELAIRRVPQESPSLPHLRQIEAAAEKAADLARQMLAYSGRGTFVIEPSDLNRIISEMMHMLEVSISKKALLRTHLAPELPVVDVDATQIRQIIMNLVINASEAIGNRNGVITITSGSLLCDARYLAGCWLQEDLAEGRYVFFEVADDGCGMDRETISRIFDPFFSTKFTGRGLGMAAVLGILRGHKGNIRVYSEPGKGSTFKVLLPVSGSTLKEADTPAESQVWRGSGRVLIIDDEHFVLNIGRTMLEELGFEVLTAAGGREGLDIYRQYGDGLRFVLLDLTMPDLDGNETFRELRQLDPEARIILTSGFNQLEVVHQFAGKGLSGFLQKPSSSTICATPSRPCISPPKADPPNPGELSRRTPRTGPEAAA